MDSYSQIVIALLLFPSDGYTVVVVVVAAILSAQHNLGPPQFSIKDPLLAGDSTLSGLALRAQVATTDMHSRNKQRRKRGQPPTITSRACWLTAAVSVETFSFSLYLIF